MHWPDVGRRLARDATPGFCACLQSFISGVKSSTIRAVEPLHRVLIDVVGDRLAYAVADLDCTRVVHSAPDPRIVTVRSCLQDVAVSAVRLTGGRQCKNLS